MKQLKPNSHLKLHFSGISVNIAIMVVFFLFGIVCGCICFSYSDISFSDTLYFGNIGETDVNPADYSLRASLFNFLKYPTVIFLLGFTALGVFAVPVLVMAKGFFVSFSVSSILYASSSGGISSAIAALGIQTLLSVPCILLISALSFEVSKAFVNIFKKKSSDIPFKHIKPREYIFVFLCMVIFSVFFSFFDTLITPKLISAITNDII